MSRSDCFRLERQLAGRASHPLGASALARRTISTELDMFSQAEDCKFWGPTLESVGLWGNLRSQRPGTPSFMSVEISVYSIPNFYNYIL